MSRFREHMKRCAEIVAAWPPWKRNLLENSMKPTCPPREPVSPRITVECSLKSKCPLMNQQPAPAPLPRQKYLFQLHNKDRRRAVIIDWSIEDAKLRCRLNDPQGGWDDASYRIIVGVRRTMTNLVLCMEMK